MRARLVRERDGAEALQHLVAGDRAGAGLDVALLVELLDALGGRALGIDEAGGVAQQVLHGDRPVERHLLRRLPLAPALGLEVAELGHPVGDRVGELHPPFLDQHHGGDRGDGLGHGRHEEDRVAPHRAWSWRRPGGRRPRGGRSARRARSARRSRGRSRARLPARRPGRGGRGARGRSPARDRHWRRRPAGGRRRRSRRRRARATRSGRRPARRRARRSGGGAGGERRAAGCQGRGHRFLPGRPRLRAADDGRLASAAALANPVADRPSPPARMPL